MKTFVSRLGVSLAALMLGLSATYGYAAPMLPTEKQDMLDAMNAVRAGVVPPAQSMPPLAWDTTLELGAQRWADQCIFQFDPNAGGVGQTIAGGSGPFAPATAVSLWAAESAFYNLATNSCSALTCGNYTQVVWARTTAVGCARSSACASTNYVCHYSPPGNFVEQSPYVAASAPPTGGTTGPQGPAGPQGPSGPMGPQGPAGPAGPTGATGLAGTPGIAGAQGPAGPMGPIGPAGPASGGLVGGAIILLPQGSATPAGFTLLGTTAMVIDRPGRFNLPLIGTYSVFQKN